MDTGPGLHRLGRLDGGRVPDARAGVGTGPGEGDGRSGAFEAPGAGRFPGFSGSLTSAAEGVPGRAGAPRSLPHGGFAVAREDAEFPGTRPFPDLPEIPALVGLPEPAGPPDGPDAPGGPELPGRPRGSSDGAALPAEVGGADQPFQERELRPARRLRLWQTLPIGAVAILGALMFGFPLAFESNGGGVLIGMLGLLLVAAAAGWGAFAAYRAGYALPGLPRVGSGRRAGWRILLGYTSVGAVVFALAVWRVARLRG